MKTYFIDTNIFLRVAVREDEKSFNESSLLLKTAEDGKIKVVTSNFVLAEYVWVMGSYYKVEKQEVIKSINGILALKNLTFVDKVSPGVALSIFSRKNVKYIDALIASNPSIWSKKWIVASYDKDFDKIGIERKEPQEIISQFYN